jgi:hypothetical protein
MVMNADQWLWMFISGNEWLWKSWEMMGNDGGFNGILMEIECGNLKIQWDILSNNQNCS